MAGWLQTLATLGLQPNAIAFITGADYAAMRTSLGLGTAAVQNVGYFATAAQGALADSAVQPGDLSTYAPLASPALTGTPTAPTAAGATNTTQIATTAFVQSAVLSDHGALTGLSDDDHTQYPLLAGRSGGQEIKGGTGSGDDLTLTSTSHGTKGEIIIGGAFHVDEVTENIHAGGTVPTTIDGVVPLFSIQHTDAKSFGTLRFSNDASGTTVRAAKSRGTTIGSHVIVQNNDVVYRLFCYGSNGTTFEPCGSLECTIDGTPGASGDMPGRWSCSTVSDGTIVLTEAWRATSEQKFLVGYTSSNGAYRLQANGQIFATSATIATSDRKFKRNIETLPEGASGLLRKLNPVSFEFKAGKADRGEVIDGVTGFDEEQDREKVVREAHNFPEGLQLGFVAQDVRDAFADQPWVGSLVKENRRKELRDKDGRKLADEEQFLGLCEGHLLPIVVKALQEQIARTDALEARLSKLEQKKSV